MIKILEKKNLQIVFYHAVLYNVYDMYTDFQTSEVVNHQGSEADKIKEMISQATKEFDPST